VADLIATDPEWARAAAQLSGALDAVAGDLARLPAPTMPDDVAARLDAALRTAERPHAAAVPATRAPVSSATTRAPGPGTRAATVGRRPVPAVGVAGHCVGAAVWRRRPRWWWSPHWAWTRWG
jgi:hypothetical protein